jgi:hypothetical protein
MELIFMIRLPLAFAIATAIIIHGSSRVLFGTVAGYILPYVRVETQLNFAERSTKISTSFASMRFWKPCQFYVPKEQQSILHAHPVRGPS